MHKQPKTRQNKHTGLCTQIQTGKTASCEILTMHVGLECLRFFATFIRGLHWGLIGGHCRGQATECVPPTLYTTESPLLFFSTTSCKNDQQHGVIKSHASHASDRTKSLIVWNVVGEYLQTSSSGQKLDKWKHKVCTEGSLYLTMFRKYVFFNRKKEVPQTRETFWSLPSVTNIFANLSSNKHVLYNDDNRIAFRITVSTHNMFECMGFVAMTKVFRSQTHKTQSEQQKKGGWEPVVLANDSAELVLAFTRL